MKSDVQIRRIFLAEDAKELMILQQDAKEFNSHYPKHKKWLAFAIDEIIKGNRYAFGIYKTKFSNNSQPIIELIGSIILKREIYTNSFELKNLYVAEEYRRNKYGKALFEVVEKFCLKRGGIQIETEVPAIERNTIAFLSNFDFYVREHTKSLFKEGDSIYRMIKDLPAKYSGDPFDLLKISSWTFENIYGYKLVSEHDSQFDYEVKINTEKISVNSGVRIIGRTLVIDQSNKADIKKIEEIINSSEVIIRSIVSRDSEKLLLDLCVKHNIHYLNLTQIRENFNDYFISEFQKFSKEDIQGIIVPIKSKYISQIISSPNMWTYMKGGPVGKFLKQGDYVIFCFEESNNNYENGIKGYAKIEECAIGQPDEIWHNFESQNPLFPKNDYKAWSSEKFEIVAFKIKKFQFIKTLSIPDVTGQTNYTPFESDRLGQYYLNKDQITSFLDKRELINQDEFDRSSLPKIFISSTIKDLSNERKEVAKLVRIDLGYNVFLSESGGSFSSPRDTIMREIEASDVYILIVGKKYGYELRHGERYISATHDEFLKAILTEATPLVYVQNVKDREQKAEDFLKEIGDYIDGTKFQYFNDTKELLRHIRKDVAKAMLSRKNQ